MFAVFDLDGTLALNEHRQHFLYRSPKDWEGWHAACADDKPCEPLVIALRDFMYAGSRVEIWTGRSVSTRNETRDWLFKHAGFTGSVRMRPVGDHRDDTVLKMEWPDACPKPPDLVFEDRKRMVDMWRSRGIVCAQVAPGDF